MKRLFILASAAIVALASCSKTQVVYKEAPEEIGLKAVTGAMTKAPVVSTTLSGSGQTMMVYAWNHSDKVSYFDATSFIETESTNVWTGTSPQYYPTTGSLDFVAYTDASTSVVTETQTNNTTYSYVLADNTETQHDLMVSNYVQNISSTTSAVAIDFTHALALIQVSFKCEQSDVIVKSVELTGTKQNGTVAVTYPSISAETPDFSPTISWTPGDTKKSITVSGNQTFTKGAAMTRYAYFLVVPEDGNVGKALNISYTLNGNTFSDKVDLVSANAYSWEQGKKYIYNITIELDEIKFSPSVTTWGTGSTTNTTL